MVVVERRFFGSAGEWIPAKIRRCWSVWIPSKAIIFPVRVLSKICICGRRRTLVLRLRWRVDSREDKALLVSLGTLLCPESCSNIVDGVRKHHLECVSLPREGLGVLPGESLDGDLHLWSSSSTSSIRLSWGVDSCEDKALLVSPDTFRCPASCFNIVDGVRRFRFEGDNLPREGLDEDLHAKIRRCWLV